MSDSYDSDFYAWTRTQADLLRHGRFEQLDIAHLIEEVEGLGRSERRQLESRLEVLLVPLLKWQFQPERRGRSWRATITEQRRKLVRLLAQNPSLKSELPESFAEAYQDARLAIVAQTDLPEETFPANCPYTLEQLVNRDFWPAAQENPS